MMRKRLILASSSPRRAQLLRDKFEELIIMPTDVEERYSSTTPDGIVCELSELKLGDLPCIYPDIPILGADTIVWYNNKVYGKPIDEQQAYLMLKELSGNTHEVYTGYTISYKGRRLTGYEKASVKFKSLDDDDIAAYVEDGSPMDKAGGYGIQDGRVVESYSGDINTIVGLPVDSILRQYDILIGGKDEQN